MREPDVKWGQASQTSYYAVHEGRIAALLYVEVPFEDQELGDFADDFVPGSRPWCLVMADRPHNHDQLAAPVLTDGMDGEELRAAHDAAIVLATMLVQERLAPEPN